MQSLTLVQFDFVKRRKYTRVFEAVEKRDKVFAEYKKICSQLSCDDFKSLSIEERERATEIEDEVNTVLENVKTKAKELIALVEGQKERCRSDIKELNATKQGMRAYYHKGGNGVSFYFDKRG